MHTIYRLNNSKNKAKIKHRTMIGPSEPGRLDMPDFQIINEALKVVWVRRLNDSNGTPSWSHIPLSYLQPVGGLFLLQSNFDFSHSLIIHVALTQLEHLILVRWVSLETQ